MWVLVGGKKEAHFQRKEKSLVKKHKVAEGMI